MSDINYKMLGEMVYRKRLRDQLTVRDLAKRLSAASFTVWRVEQGKDKCTAEHLVMFCNWLGITPTRLTGRKFLVSSKGKGESTLDVIHSLILGDKTLNREAKLSLLKIMEIGYMLATK